MKFDVYNCFFAFNVSTMTVNEQCMRIKKCNACNMASLHMKIDSIIAAIASKQCVGNDFIFTIFVCFLQNMPKFLI